MNLKNKHIIQNRIKEIKKKKNKIFFKGLKTYNYFEFKTKLNSINFVLKCLNLLSNGYILVLKDSISSKFLDTAKKKLKIFAKKTSPISPKIKSGIKNGFYISKSLNSEGYKTVDRSFYFFSWNKDKLGIYKKIINIYKPLKILNGLKSNEITKNKPQDGIIERLHIINYPSYSGKITRHYDPINVSIFNFGLYATEYGKDYSSGGFFALNKKNKKILIDKKIKKTDIVLFFPSLIHGVDKVKNENICNSDGRWFINVNHIQSHEVKNREYTKKH
tara:strand:+ start:4686 stop:5510 length:825 start_codon:yes stop_codon:yes gene_type:complete